jgi:hypothetical protein
MAHQTRSSVLFIVEETTEGTPKAPSSGSEAVALQEGYELIPAFEVLENAELKSSIGLSKPLLGLESPTASISHYFRHSGVEGQAPTYGPLLESALGTVDVNSTQYTTTSSSTAGTASARAVIKSTGNASNFQRGQGLLIKDGTNGYRIRNVYATSGSDDLQLSFNLANAPASGVGLGKSVSYIPANADHESLSLWDYRANGGAIQLIAGAKVSEFSVEVTAGEFINASYSLEGTSFYFNPIEIASADRYLDFLDDATTRAAVVEAKMYKDPHDLASALQTSMNALGSGNTFTVTYSDTTGKFTIASDGSTLSLLWNSGTNTANTIGDKIGFSVGADDTGALTYTSDNALTLTRPYTPAFDSADPLVAKNGEIMLGDFDDYGCVSISSATLTISNEQVALNSVCEESGREALLADSRTVTLSVVANLSSYDADKFRRYRAGSNTSAAFDFGEKSGGNWVAGKCVNVYMPDSVITEFQLSDTDGLVTMNMTLQSYVDSSGNGEVYVNLL